MARVAAPPHSCRCRCGAERQKQDDINTLKCVHIIVELEAPRLTVESLAKVSDAVSDAVLCDVDGGVVQNVILGDDVTEGDAGESDESAASLGSNVGLSLGIGVRGVHLHVGGGVDICQMSECQNDVGCIDILLRRDAAWAAIWAAI